MFEITSVLWRRRWVVVAVAAGLMVIGSAMVLVGRTTTYTATSQVLVDQPDLLGTSGGASVPAKLASLGPTFCRLLEGDRAVESIASDAGVDAPTARDLTRCRPVEGTTVIEVSATSTSPGRAEALATAAADELASQIDDRYSGGDVPTREYIDGSVLVSARRPTATPDQTVRQLALVAAFALIIAAAFAVAAEPHRATPLASGLTAPEAAVTSNGTSPRVPAGRP